MVNGNINYSVCQHQRIKNRENKDKKRKKLSVDKANYDVLLLILLAFRHLPQVLFLFLPAWIPHNRNYVVSTFSLAKVRAFGSVFCGFRRFPLYKFSLY